MTTLERLKQAARSGGHVAVDGKTILALVAAAEALRRAKIDLTAICDVFALNDRILALNAIHRIDAALAALEETDAAPEGRRQTT